MPWRFWGRASYATVRTRCECVQFVISGIQFIIISYNIHTAAHINYNSNNITFPSKINGWERYESPANVCSTFMLLLNANVEENITATLPVSSGKVNFEWKEKWSEDVHKLLFSSLSRLFHLLSVICIISHVITDLCFNHIHVRADNY